MLSVYNATKNINKVLNSFKDDKFRINCRVKESDIDELEMIRERLESFTLKVHDGAEDNIDNIFNIEVMHLLEDLYSFNPGEITLSYGSKTNLASMIGVVTIDKDLRDSFLSKVNELDNDEMSNPEDKKNMDKLFADMIKDGNYDDDISNIKFIAYTAEEPYKSVFFKYLPDVEIGTYDLPNDGTVKQSYLTGPKKLTLDFNNFKGSKKRITGLNDTSGPYVTFFHEYGHAIDDLAKKDCIGKVNIHTSSFEYDGKLFQDVIKENIHNFISKVAEDCIRKDVNFNGDTKKYISNCANVVTNHMMKAGEDYSMLANELKSIYTDVKDEIGYYTIKPDGDLDSYIVGKSYDFTDIKHGAFSDLLGGMTDNSVSGPFVHKSRYWFNSEGKSENMEQEEAYAHLFASGMTGLSYLEEGLDEYLPLSSEYFDLMMEDLLNE